MRVETVGLIEWITTLAKFWNIKDTILRDNEERLTVVHQSRYRGSKNMVMVGSYDKLTEKGYVLDRRGEIRE